MEPLKLREPRGAGSKSGAQTKPEVANALRTCDDAHGIRHHRHAAKEQRQAAGQANEHGYERK